MTIGQAIQKFEKQRLAAKAVLDSGFGIHPGESDRLYTERKEMAEIALWALCEVERMYRERRRMKAILSQIVTLLEDEE